MKSGVNFFERRTRWQRRVRRIVTGLSVGLLLAVTVCQAADEKKKGKSTSLGGLFDSLKELKVPDSVVKFPEQLKELNQKGRRRVNKHSK